MRWRFLDSDMRPLDKTYVLRVWRDTADTAALRASLREIHSQTTRNFADLQELLEYLNQSSQSEEQK